MIVLDKIEKFIFESAAWKIVLAILMISLIKTGIWYIPNIDLLINIAQNPFENPFSNPNQHYLFWNWLGPFLAWLVGATDRWRFFAFHFAFSLAFTAIFIRFIFVNLSDKSARISLIIFSCLPVSATSYFWVGVDSLTLFLMILSLSFPSSLLFVFVVAILLGMQHFEQGLFASSALLIAIYLSHRQGYALRYSWRFCAALLVGVIVGKIILHLIFDYSGIEVNSGRPRWLQTFFPVVIQQFFFHSQWIVWSALGLGWLVALRFIDWGKRSVPFFISLGALCLLLPIVGDQTRVFAMVTFPLIAAYWLFNEDFLGNLTKKEVSLLATAWTLMPWGWVWGGGARWSVFPHDVAYVLHRLFGWFNIPADPALWPFR